MFTSVRRLLRTPEVQFFAIFTIPFIGCYVLNYINLPERYQPLATALFGGTFVIVLLQTIYSIYAHRALKKQESEFMGATAHHIGAPLTAVKWTLEELAKNTGTPEERAELARMASESMKTLVAIISDLTQVTQLEGEGDDLAQETVAVSDIVDSVTRAAALIGKQHGIAVYTEPMQEQAEVWVDAGRVGIALSNVVMNAIAYNRPGGMVTIRARRLPGEHYAEITVEDTGIGIAPENIKRLFTKYYRAENARQVRTTGTGLGLYLTKAIIERHGGKVWVESVLGKGSSFHLTLPLSRD